MELKNIPVVCFGEVLFDLFPSGPKPGGAPMNVAINLQKLGVPAAIISRVGKDKLGDDLLAFLRSKQVNTDLLQTDARRETGTVRVNIDKNDDPEYTIVEKVAWDYIDDSFLSLGIHPKYVVHGSLACRSAESYRSLQKLLSSTNGKVIFDLNVRSPFYSKSVIDQLLKTAHIVKLNMEEFKMIKEWFYIKNPKEQGDLKAIKALYPNVEIIIVTKGGRGAIAWQNGKMETAPVVAIKVNDTVGSGDAFLGGFISKLDQGSPLKDCLRFATATGALVATHAGANPDYSEKDILSLIPKS